MSSVDLSKILLAVYALYPGTFSLLKRIGNANKKISVMNIHRIINLILFHAFLIFSVSQDEKMNWKIAKKNA